MLACATAVTRETLATELVVSAYVTLAMKGTNVNEVQLIS